MGCRATLGVDSTGETVKEVFLVSFTWSLLDSLSELPRRLQKPSSFNGDYIGGILDPGQTLICMIFTSRTIPAIYAWHWF